jgi:hypothetical protein
MAEQTLSAEQVEAAFRDIDRLAREEYGLTLRRLLESPMAEDRLRRLAGVMLKAPFAYSTDPDSYNPTDARRSWHWDAARFDDPRLAGSGEYELLNQLRDEEGRGSWDDLQDITHEAGLMWVLGKWLKGRLVGEAKSFREYYYEPTPPEVDLALSAVDLLPIASVLAGVVGVPVLAVNLALIVTKFGYEKLTEPPTQPE